MISKSNVKLVTCDGVFVVIYFKTMYHSKTIIRFDFCDIRNSQGHCNCYQPRPWARLMTLTSTLIIPDITKTLSNNCLLCVLICCRGTWEGCEWQHTCKEFRVKTKKRDQFRFLGDCPSTPPLRPKLTLTLTSHLGQNVGKKENKISLPSIISNLTNDKNELWKLNCQPFKFSKTPLVIRFNLLQVCLSVPPFIFAVLFTSSFLCFKG